MRSRLATLVAGSSLTLFSLLASPRSAFAQEPPMAPTPPAPPATPAAAAAAEAALPAPTSISPSSTTAAHPASERVPTSIEGTKEGIVIERRLSTEESGGRFAFVLPMEATTDKWEPVCVTPCKVELPRWSTYRVGRANGVTSSGEFTLPSTRDSLKLGIEAGNLNVHRLGSLFVGTGTAAAITGAALIAASVKFHDEKPPRTAGIITGAAGLLLLAVGIPIAIATQSHVVDSDAAKLAKAKPAKPHLTLDGLIF